MLSYGLPTSLLTELDGLPSSLPGLYAPSLRFATGGRPPASPGLLDSHSKVDVNLECVF